ncbi:hypothetical protein HNQ36_004422 [Afipia massiliensis]|uniref:DUF4435 domain-containing protein n=1 Tax=Afipia massiliensis TaxID=211460 RepID=A0A840N5G3_9BRAD|nr:hypothetical protein [Afipia massiliensis]MBB5054420.1 hypothetical protein [Afipia massiliensis]
MKSISSNIDAYDIAQQVRQERQVHKGSFLLLEGLTDIRRFEKFVDKDKNQTINCFGRENLIGAIELLYDEAFPGALGLADADFDRVNNSLKEHEGIIYSDSHDFDMDCAATTCLQAYLNETGDVEKCEAIGTTEVIRQMIAERVKPLSVLRLVNVTQQFRYNLQWLDHDKFIIGNQLDQDVLINEVSQGAFAQNKPVLTMLVSQHSAIDYDLAQITCGHDFYACLGLALRQQLGARKIPQSWRREVEMHFRLAFNDVHFAETNLLKRILEWERENKPYIILAARFRAA